MVPLFMHVAAFALCPAAGADCVVDGDTFWMAGAKIRIADIDTPETRGARCPAERRAGTAATLRLRNLLNAAPFALKAVGRETDRYGRLLRVVERGGRSLGETLVTEGLARRYDGGRREGWCANDATPYRGGALSDHP